MTTISLSIMTTINMKKISNIFWLPTGITHSNDTLIINLNSVQNINIHVNKIKSFILHNNKKVNHINLIQNNNDYISIRDNFLINCTFFTSINISSINKIICIHSNFLSNSALTTFDTSGLTNLTSIGNNFLSHCSNLTSFNASGLTSIQRIGDNFMTFTKLTTFDASGSLTKLRTIGENFLSKCSDLTKINISGMISLHSVSESFINNNPNLTNIDISELNLNLDYTCLRFICGNAKLITVNLTNCALSYCASSYDALLYYYYMYDSSECINCLFEYSSPNLTIVTKGSDKLYNKLRCKFNCVKKLTYKPIIYLTDICEI